MIKIEENTEKCFTIFIKSINKCNPIYSLLHFTEIAPDNKNKLLKRPSCVHQVAQSVNLMTAGSETQQGQPLGSVRFHLTSPICSLAEIN